ncbi:tetratricopeptide repeat protein [Nostoc commune]|uniref:tetratricopeptide repeat protein n=1 Tax=Nostoc commune TaxID=1178 RepID=UPI0018C6B2CC|nr:tetratricopeptide repeat protein [Nostoc commune]MBG1261514.1 tetratricopeptide repeat protein [Nostoc commune BAE]MBG1261558.1 tetratricopeptide repeat protein [Nostoc commune BAE]
MDIAKKQKNHRAVADSLHYLGNVSLSMRQFHQARDYYQQALEIKIEFGDRYSCARTYAGLGLLAQAEEKYVEVRANLQTALEIYVEYQDEYMATVAREILESLPE